MNRSVVRTLNTLTVSPAKGLDLPRRGILCMILNCIRWWGSSSRDLESVKNPFIAITSRSTQTQSSSTC